MKALKESVWQNCMISLVFDAQAKWLKTSMNFHVEYQLTKHDNTPYIPEWFTSPYAEYKCFIHSGLPIE